ncbi:hypothetical protein [Nocardia pseudovaccinii]|uniref:hypothetical protein n=1 Tax=Nocardia pseudovaccinii TaxID=189540 RepID=UPI0007A4F7AD|nr:hypothetical protein [Nocardia pseudovaccinii]
MPSILHEAVIDLFRQRPQLAAELLELVLDNPLPEFDHARLESGDFPDIDPTEYRADSVVVLATGTTPVLAVVVEVQLQPDSDKSWSWPVYLTTLRARLHCLTILLVLCPNERTANYCRKPITVAPEFTLRPVVLSPKDVPIVTEPEVAADNPELAVLSAIAHRNHPERNAILTTLAASVFPAPRGEMYIDLVTAILPKAARHFLESLMTTGTYEYKSEFARRYFSQGEAKGEAKGEARGEAKALLRILAKRGFDVSDALEARINACTDLDQLDSWIDRALTATRIDEIFPK